jgi:hypothetical protein
MSSDVPPLAEEVRRLREQVSVLTEVLNYHHQTIGTLSQGSLPLNYVEHCKSSRMLEPYVDDAVSTRRLMETHAVET